MLHKCVGCRYEGVNCMEEIGTCSNFDKFEPRHFIADINGSVHNGGMGTLEAKEGPVRFDQGKPKMALLPPHALMAVAKSMTNDKYSDYNYLTKGYSHVDLLSKAMRHITQHLMGFDIDDESGNTHLANSIANLMMLLELVSLGMDSDDRWKEKGES